MAHLIYDFLESDGEKVLDIEDEYMFGRSLLVAPIINEGETARSIYLPRGRWIDFWTGEPVNGGVKIEKACGFDRIPVFVKYGAVLSVDLNGNMCMGTTDVSGKMGNEPGKYENFGLLVYGGTAEAEVDDETAGKFRLRWEDGQPKQWATDVAGLRLCDGTGGGLPGREELCCWGPLRSAHSRSQA